MKQKKSTHPKPFKKDSSHTLGMTSREKSEILQKLSILEELLKKKDDKPLTFREACAYLGYAPSYLYKLTYRNVIPHYKPTGKMIFFSKNEIDEWIYSSEECRVKNAELKTEDTSAVLRTKDPNQIEMFKKAKGNGEEAKEEAEIIIEFPLKSRRRKEL
jgi:excisionase family DNA binding protein